MQFLTVAVLATSVAAGLVERDPATANAVADVISGIAAQVNKVDAAAKAYTSGDPSTALAAAGPLEDAINAGTTKVNGLSGTIGITEAGIVAPPLTGSLAPAASALVSDLIAKRSAVEAAGACDKVESVVKTVASDSDALIAAIVKKVDPIAASVASSLAAQVQGPLSSAVAAFGTASCTNKAGSGSSSTAAAGTTTKAAGSTSAAASSSAASSKATSAATSAAGTTVAVSTKAGTTAVAAPTSVGAGSTFVPTGSAPHSTPSAVPPPTQNGAAAFAPMGALALALAAIAM